MEELTACIRGLSLFHRVVGFPLRSQKENLAGCLQNTVGLPLVGNLSYKLLGEHKAWSITSAVTHGMGTALLFPKD